MKFLNRLERRLGDYAIPHLTIVLILFQSFTYLVSLVHPEYMSKSLFSRMTPSLPGSGGGC